MLSCRAKATMHDLEHPFMDDLQCGVGYAKLRKHHFVLDSAKRWRDSPFAIRQSRGHHSKLQRRDQNISLADTGDDGLAGVHTTPCVDSFHS